MNMREFREKLVNILGEPDSEDSMVDSHVRWEWGPLQVNVYGIWDNSDGWDINMFSVNSPDAVIACASAWKGAKDA